MWERQAPRDRSAQQAHLADLRVPQDRLAPRGHSADQLDPQVPRDSLELQVLQVLPAHLVDRPAPQVPPGPLDPSARKGSQGPLGQRGLPDPQDRRARRVLESKGRPVSAPLDPQGHRAPQGL